MAKSKTPMRPTASPPENPSSSSIEITASAQIDIEAAAGDGQAALPRFRMIAYTGGAMRVAA